MAIPFFGKAQPTFLTTDDVLDQFNKIVSDLNAINARETATAEDFDVEIARLSAAREIAQKEAAKAAAARDRIRALIDGPDDRA